MRKKKKEFYSIEHFYEWLWNNWGCLGRKVPGEDIKKYRRYVKKLEKEGWIKKDPKGNWSLKKDWNILVRKLNEETKKKCERFLCLAVALERS